MPAAARAPAALHAARKAVGEVLDAEALNLVACSGGADSLALATAAAWHHKRGSHQVGAVVVDHQLQPGSAEVTEKAVDQLQSLGVEPVLAISTEVQSDSSEGPEAAARKARYRAFAQAMANSGATRILLGHTRDDQAEQVLLGLARGSGTRSLAGIPAERGPFRRPLLGLTRAETEAICAHAGLVPWHDPQNDDPQFLRSKVRSQVLPYLEQNLDPGIRDALVRTAEIATADAQYLENQAQGVFAQLLEDPDEQGRLRLKLKGLRAQPPAIRRRVIALAVVACAVPAPSQERIAAVEQLVTGSRSAGPVQLEGRLEVYRGARSSPEYGKLVLVPTPC